MLLSEKNLQRFLEFHGIEGEIVEFDTVVMGSERASKVVSEGVVVKSIVLIADDKPILCILRGKDRIDLEKIKKLKNCKEVRLAKAKEVKEITGYDIGGVPPFGHLNKLETIVDEKIRELANETLFLGGGSHYHLLKITGKELFRVLEEVVGNTEIAEIRE